MHTREYAAAALAELTEELDRLGCLSAASESMAAAYRHTADAVRGLISAEFRPWIETMLADIRQTYGIEEASPLQAGIEAVAEALSDIAPEVTIAASGEASGPAF